MVKNLGKRLKYARLKRNFTQNELATKLDIKPNNIGHYESGTALPKLDTIIKISEVLNCSIDWLVAGKGEKPMSEEEEMIESLLSESVSDQEPNHKIKKLASYLVEEMNLVKQKVTDQIAAVVVSGNLFWKNYSWFSTGSVTPQLF